MLKVESLLKAGGSSESYSQSQGMLKLSHHVMKLHLPKSLSAEQLLEVAGYTRWVGIRKEHINCNTSNCG